tara:strand:- start:1012 stop:1254 length:243 start_codon:yes stop_codon:yes gene_type:complete
MNKIVIFITMFFSDPTVAPNSVVINTFNNEPLFFNNVDECRLWVENDLENLKDFALTLYPNAIAVKQIHCVEKGTLRNEV